MRNISLRVLNRILLDRQFLLSRDSRSAFGVVERLVALQSQEPNWPYIGLWARASEFHTDDLVRLLTTRQLVRAAGIGRRGLFSVSPLCHNRTYVRWKWWGVAGGFGGDGNVSGSGGFPFDFDG